MTATRLWPRKPVAASFIVVIGLSLLWSSSPPSSRSRARTESESPLTAPASNYGVALLRVFVLAEGNAVVTENGRELSTQAPGDYFGEIALFGNGRRSATVTTKTPARLFVMFGTEFRRLEQAHPDIAARLAAAAREREGTS